jgi:hypothetical protein
MLADLAADAHYRLARLYEATGRRGEAQRELANAGLTLVKNLHERTREDLLLKVSGSPPDAK